MRDQIDASRLKSLRGQAGFSQAKLADVAKVSKRRIVELERGEGLKRANRRTIKSLATALRVEPRVLTGEIAVPGDYDPRSDEPRGSPLQVRLDPRTRLNYDLIEHRYGVSAQWVFDHAPLFLALLAAQSFEWRRARLQAARSALAELAAQAAVFSGDVSRDQISEAIEVEARALEAGELRTLRRDSAGDSFTDFLLSLVDGEGGARDVALSKKRVGRLDYLVSQEAFAAACGTENPNSEAAKALREGDVRLRDIPSELWEQGKDEARREWLGRHLLTPAERWNATGDLTRVTLEDLTR